MKRHGIGNKTKIARQQQLIQTKLKVIPLEIETMLVEAEIGVNPIQPHKWKKGITKKMKELKK